MTEMFEIYSKEIEIDGLTYKLRPLSGRFLPKLYAIISKFEGVKEGEDNTEAAFKLLDEDSISKLHELMLETFKKSYPKEDPEKLDEFISQNMLKLFGPLMEVNLNMASVEKDTK